MQDHGHASALPERPDAQARIALVGGCHCGVAIPADDLAEFYRGYGAMAKAALAVALLWGMVLGLAQCTS